MAEQDSELWVFANLSIIGSMGIKFAVVARQVFVRVFTLTASSGISNFEARVARAPVACCEIKGRARTK